LKGNFEKIGFAFDGFVEGMVGQVELTRLRVRGLVAP